MVGLDMLGRLLLILGVILAVVGIILLLLGRVPFLGRLPGDILIQRDNVTIWIPIATMLLLSVLLSLILFVVSLIFRR